MSLTALDEHRIVIVGGSGGVGKTSISAAVGIRCALDGYNTLVLTIDPARRLAGALGMEGIGRDAVDVTPRLDEEGLAPSGTLHAMMLDVQNTFDRLVARYAPDEATRQQILANRLYQNISTRLSGSQEYASMQRLYEIATEEGYERIVLDTPPTTHALDFLTAPQRLMAFFDSRVVQVFVNFGGRVGWNIFRRSTDMFLKALERLTGSGLIHEISEFFEITETVLEPYRTQSDRTQELLRDKDTAFLIVSGPNRYQLDDAEEFRRKLVEMGIDVAGVAVNRWLPPAADEEAALPEVPTGGDELVRDVVGWGTKLERLSREQARILREMARDGELELVRIPIFDEDVHSIAGLMRMVRELRGEGKAAT